MAAKPKPPLDGIRVLDLSRILAGPWCAMVLGDLGAEVIKVENPAGGDDTRDFGPPFGAGESAYYMAANRNKRGIVADLKTEEGQGIVRRLAAVSDVLIENFRLGTMEKFDLALDDLRAANPRLITCSISGYGRMSPLANRGGYDFMIQAESGLMSITGEPDGPALRVGVATADLTTGANAVQAILAALYAREKTGTGQHVDLALLDCQVAALANVTASCLMSGQRPKRYANAHPNVAPYQTFATQDEPLVLAVGNDRQFRALCRMLGRDGLAEDPRFAANRARNENREALAAELGPIFAAKGRDAWLAKLYAAGIPAGSLRAVDEMLASPEVEAAGLVHEMAHPAMGTCRLVGSPLRFSATPVAEPFHPPTLGEHTVEVLTGVLGMTEAEAEDYAARLAAGPEA